MPVCSALPERLQAGWPALLELLDAARLVAAHDGEDREDERVSELEREQYEKRMRDAKVSEKQEDLSYDTAPDESNPTQEDQSSAGGAYLTE